MTRADSIEMTLPAILACPATVANCAFAILCGRLLHRFSIRKKWLLANPDQTNEKRYGKAYSRAASMKHFWKNREACLARRRAWYQKNREYCLVRASEYGKAHYAENKAKIIARGNAWTKRKYESEPSFRMMIALRVRLRRLVHREARDPRTDYLGCTKEEFFAHIEKQFKDGMTWNNYGRGRGKWTIDHIKPVSRFDHTDKEQMRACWHFSNLQPLWYEDNCRKNARPNAV